MNRWILAKASRERFRWHLVQQRCITETGSQLNIIHSVRLTSTLVWQIWSHTIHKDSASNYTCIYLCLQEQRVNHSFLLWFSLESPMVLLANWNTADLPQHGEYSFPNERKTRTINCFVFCYCFMIIWLNRDRNTMKKLSVEGYMDNEDHRGGSGCSLFSRKTKQDIDFNKITMC